MFQLVQSKRFEAFESSREILDSDDVTSILTFDVIVATEGPSSKKNDLKWKITLF